jgi:hypothetical protein
MQNSFASEIISPFVTKIKPRFSSYRHCIDARVMYLHPMAPMLFAAKIKASILRLRVVSLVQFAFGNGIIPYEDILFQPVLPCYYRELSE